MPPLLWLCMERWGLGKFPSHSRPSPHQSPHCHLQFLAGWRNPPCSWTRSVSDVPPMPCLERVSEWLVPVYPSGDVGLRDVFLSAYLLLFPAAAIRPFNLGGLNPGESGPNTSAESRGNFRTFTLCRPRSSPSPTFSGLSGFVLAKGKKKNCAEKITWPLHKTEFI